MRDYKSWYGVYLRAGMLSSVIITILLFLLIPYAEPEPYKRRVESVTRVEEISSVIIQSGYSPPPPSERPKVAVVAEVGDEQTDNVETISSTELFEGRTGLGNGNGIAGPEIEVVPFYKVEVKPEPVFIPKPEYPELAKKAGIEGRVVVKMEIEIDGSVMDAQILRSSGNQNLDEAALSQARKCKFKPARQRDKLVRVWVNMPFDFYLEDAP